MVKRFDKKFVFGIGSSALQTEEYSNNDWHNIEAKDGSVLDRNIEHIKYWKTDYDLIKELGVNAYKTSIDWARLQKGPLEPLDKRAVEQYQHMFADLKRKGIDLYLVLHHFANPIWFDNAGGWESSNSVEYFKDFAKKAVDAFGKYTKNILTINEPITAVSLSHFSGFVYPHKKNDVLGAAMSLGNMGKAHRSVYSSIKAKYPDKKVSFVEAARPFLSHHSKFDEKVMAEFAKSGNKFSWDVMIKDPDPEHADIVYADFIAMDYYGPYAVNSEDKAEPLKFRPQMEHDDLWEIDAKEMIKQAKKFKKEYNLPVLITENGTCSNDDYARQKYLVNHLSEIADANTKEKLIDGYFHWTITDNFELDKGMSAKFGLVSVGKDMSRTKKPSFDLYRKIISKKRISDELLEKYRTRKSSLESIMSVLMAVSGLGIILSLTPQFSANLQTAQQIQLAPPLPSYGLYALCAILIAGIAYFAIKKIRIRRLYI